MELCFSFSFWIQRKRSMKRQKKELFFLSYSIDTFSILNKDFFKEEKVNDCVMMFLACSCPAAPSNSTTYFPDESKLSVMASLKNNMRTRSQLRLWNSLWEMCKSILLRNAQISQKYIDGIVLKLEILLWYLECTCDYANLQGHSHSHFSRMLKLRFNLNPVITGIIFINQYSHSP